MRDWLVAHSWLLWSAGGMLAARLAASFGRGRDE